LPLFGTIRYKLPKKDASLTKKINVSSATTHNFFISNNQKKIVFSQQLKTANFKDLACVFNANQIIISKSAKSAIKFANE